MLAKSVAFGLILWLLLIFACIPSFNDPSSRSLHFILDAGLSNY